MCGCHGHTRISTKVITQILSGSVPDLKDVLTMMHKKGMLSPYLATTEFSRHTVGMHSHFAVFILAKLCLQQQPHRTLSNLPLSSTLDTVGLETQRKLVPTSDINENSKRETQNKLARYLIKGWQNLVS